LKAKRGFLVNIKLLVIISLIASSIVVFKELRTPQSLGKCVPQKSKEVEPYWDPPPFKNIQRDSTGRILMTKEFLLEKVDRNVIHGIVRRINLNKNELVVAALIEDEENINLNEGTLPYKAKTFTISWDKETVFDNRQKYPEEQIGDFAKLRFLCASELAIGDWLIIFSKDLAPIIHEDSFTASRMLLQSYQYSEGLLDLFKEHGIFP
jgi:hypothetical protein